MGFIDELGNPLGVAKSLLKRLSVGPKPFVRTIAPNGPDEAIHSSPGAAAVITILRWDNRDTVFLTGDFIKIRRFLVIIYDCFTLI